MSNADVVAAQLIEELGGLPIAVGAVYGVEVAELLEQRHEARWSVVAAEMCSEDDRLAAEAVRTLIALRWPEGEIAPEWWRTPAGRAVARSIGRDDADAVSPSVAAAILGVSPGTVRQLLFRADHQLSGSGGLQRHPEGGITRASVLANLCARQPPA